MLLVEAGEVLGLLPVNLHHDAFHFKMDSICLESI